MTFAQAPIASPTPSALLHGHCYDFEIWSIASFTRLVVTKFNVVVAPDAAVVSVKLATVGVATVVENASAPAVGSPYVPAEVAPTHTTPLVTAAKPVEPPN